MVDGTRILAAGVNRRREQYLDGWQFWRCANTSEHLYTGMVIQVYSMLDTYTGSCRNTVVSWLTSKPSIILLAQASPIRDCLKLDDMLQQASCWYWIPFSIACSCVWVDRFIDLDLVASVYKFHILSSYHVMVIPQHHPSSKALWRSG